MLLCSSGMQRWLCGSRKKKKREEQYIDNNAVKTAPQGKMEPWFRRFSMNRNKTDLIVGHVCRYLYSKPDTQSESDLKGHSSDGWSTTFRLFVVDAVSYDAAFCTTCVNLWKRRSWILVILLFRHFSVYIWCKGMERYTKFCDMAIKRTGLWWQDVVRETGDDVQHDAAGRMETLDLCSEDRASERRARPLPPFVFTS